MLGSEIYPVLKNLGATDLYHANSVATSCTFLEQGGLLSREYAESNGLKQTPQKSDQEDKKFGIWDRIFLDHVDIHARGGRKQAPNHYGPVLFQLDLDILLQLPEGADILVTKYNPMYWKDNESDSDHWFRNLEELAKSIHLGDFQKMLVIQTPTGQLDFPNRRTRVILDDPRRQTSSGEDAYEYAQRQLAEAAEVGKVEVSISQRACQDGCVCLEQYKHRDVDPWFS